MLTGRTCGVLRRQIYKTVSDSKRLSQIRDTDTIIVYQIAPRAEFLVEVRPRIAFLCLATQRATHTYTHTHPVALAPLNNNTPCRCCGDR